MFPEGNVPGYVCNPGSPRERDAASQGHTSGIPTRALLHSWKLAPAAHHGLLSILVVTSPAPDVWLSILTDYTYDSELDIADGVPLAFRRSVSFPRGTRVTYVTWDDLRHQTQKVKFFFHCCKTLNRKLKSTWNTWNRNNCNIIIVFPITFDQLNTHSFFKFTYRQTFE